MIYIETGSTDVYYNFGLENYFATEKRLPDTVFLFWRTTPTLMVGKYQNILEEINKPYADAHGIHLVRRMSGGGTIYTDLGGWQFTFIEHSPEQQIEFAQYIGPVVDAVRELGAKSVVITSAVVNGTNAVIGYDHVAGEYFTIPFELIPVYFPGTGDTFSAVLVGRVMAGWSLQRATSDAMRVVAELIERNADQEDKSAGLPIEACLDVIDHE